MAYAFLYLGICLLGYAAAIPLRKYKSRLNWFGKAQTAAVLFLVLSMGIRVGSNKDVVANLDTYGLYSLVFTVVVVICSMIVLHFTRKIIGLDRCGMAVDKGKKRASDPPDGGTDVVANGEPQNKVKKRAIIDRMTLMILAAVCAGITSGYFFFLDRFGYERVSSASSTAITAGLCILLIFVGLDLGLDGQVLDNIRRVGFRILAIPVAIAIGTLAGALICSLFLPLHANESLAVGAGFAWYSLGAGIIMDAGFEAAGAISFMHNVMRELMGIIFVPMAAKKAGYVEALAIPASTDMDVCLPIVEQSTNGSTAVYSFITGFMLSMSVPLLVPLFLSL